MLGYDISWSAFNVIEVMSSNKFTFKVSEYSLTFTKLFLIRAMNVKREIKANPIIGEMSFSEIFIMTTAFTSLTLRD